MSRAAMRHMSIAGLVIAWFGLMMTVAFAHSWYPYDCCSDRDCWPMGLDADAREPEPAVVPGGYRLRDGTFVAERDTRPSRDGRFHVCRRAGMADGAMIRPSEKPACLFVPGRAS